MWLALFRVQLVLLVSYLINDLGTALQKLDSVAFRYSLAVFGVLATVSIVRAVVNVLIVNAFAIYWRIWLTDQVIGDWLNGLAFYRGQFVTKPVDNPDQRIEQDIAEFTDRSQSLFLGAVTSVNSIVVLPLSCGSCRGRFGCSFTPFREQWFSRPYLYIEAYSGQRYRSCMTRLELQRSAVDQDR